MNISSGAYLEQYLKILHCPRCGNEDLDDPFTYFVEEREMERRYECPDCGFEWAECWRIERVKILDHEMHEGVDK